MSEYFAGINGREPMKKTILIPNTVEAMNGILMVA